MFIMSIKISNISYILFYIAVAEALSLIGYFLPNIGVFLFMAILIFFLAVCMLEIRYGFYILLAELLISSKGYLFFLDVGGIRFSVRIALFLIFMSVWLAGLLFKTVRERKLRIEFSRSVFYPYFIVFFIFIIWGIVNGYLNGYSFDNLFFDMNGWLYFALIFPAYESIDGRKALETVWSIFFAALAWLSAKTIILVYLFSHEFPFIESIYKWVRDTGVGEITRMESSFYRIFFQSHIYIIVGYFIFALFFASALKERISGVYRTYLAWLCVLSGAIIVSLSRSFWLGLFMGGLLMAVLAIIIFKKNLRGLIVFSGQLALGALLGIVLIIIAVKFPLPRPFGEFSANDIGERAIQITDEPGASSRWALLPVLHKAIVRHPILGSGFGAAVTYISSDPRVLKESPDGEYTTYAFEWGWHDIWLKLGFFGLLAYGFVLFFIILELIIGRPKEEKQTVDKDRSFSASARDALRQSAILVKRIARIAGISKRIEAKDSVFKAGLAIGLVAIAVVNVFSPYLNHPLGIGMIILAALTADSLGKNEDKKSV